MLDSLTGWLAELAKKVFGALWDFVSDAFVSILSAFLTAFAALITAIPVPQFMQDGLTTLFNGMSPAIMYLVVSAGALQGLALIGAGFAFRIVRKFVTLFQW